MLKHYLWLLHFMVLPLAAYLVADMINLFIGSRLEASVKPPGVELSSPFPLTAGGKSYNEILEGNIFNAKVRGEEEAKPIPVQSEPSTEPPVDLRIQLTGTVVGEGGASYAIIEHQITREQQLYRIGDSVEGQARIVRIDRDEVVLSFGKTERRLRLYEEEPKPGFPMMASAVSPETGVVKVTPNQWVLDRQEISAALDDLPRLLTKARVVPNFEAGRPNGFRVFSIVPNSFFAKIGLQNGDVLQRINDIEIKDPENFMRVFQQLKGESSVSLDLVRNNQKYTFAYEIR